LAPKYTIKFIKMNWGKKIIVAYGLFVVGIMVLVVKSISQENELVVSDYYAQELKYQDKLDASKRAAGLYESIAISYDKQYIHFVFPNDSRCEEIKGTINIYCASDRSKDKQQKFSLSKEKKEFQITYQGYGTRKIEISWTKNGLSYFTEKEIFLQ